MAYRDRLFTYLANSPDLTSQLAEVPGPMEGDPPQPAIFEKWAAPDTPMPYINMRYSMGNGGGRRRSGTVTFDMFAPGNDSRVIEGINDALKVLLDTAILYDEKDGPLRLYLDNEFEIDEPEENENVLHWQTTFTLIYWQRSFAAIQRVHETR